MTSIIEIKGDDGTSLGNYEVPPEGKPVPEVLDSIFKKHGLDGVLVEDDSTDLTKSDLVTAGHTYTFWPSINVPPPEGDSPSKKRKKSPDEAGRLSGVQAMVKLDDQHPMSRFVESLSLVREDLERARNHSGFVIRLPDGVLWNGDDWCFSNELFVRRSYVELREAHYTLKRGSVTLFTGTPGIGKSHLAALMVAEFLIDGQVVLLEIVSLSKTEVTHIYYRLQLCEDGSAIVHRTYSLITALEALEELVMLVGEGKEPVYVVDGGYPSLYDFFSSSQCEKLIFGSPNRDYKKIQQKNPGLLVLYVPLFDLVELLECAKAVTCLKQIPESEIRESFAYAGGVARTVFRNQISKIGFQNWKKLVEEDINNNALKN